MSEIKLITVKKGDTLSAIARDNNTTVNAILQNNIQIMDPNKIYVGEEIAVPTETMDFGEITDVEVAPVEEQAPVAQEVPAETQENVVEEIQVNNEAPVEEQAPVAPEPEQEPAPEPTPEPAPEPTPEPIVEQIAPAQSGGVSGSISPGTETTTHVANAYNLSDEEYRQLVAVVYAEASEDPNWVESDTMGVTSAILNRVESNRYAGNDVLSIISSPKQFSGYGYQNVKYAKAMKDMSVVSQPMLNAINRVLAGERNTYGHSFSGNGTYNSFRV